MGSTCVTVLCNAPAAASAQQAATPEAHCRNDHLEPGREPAIPAAEPAASGAVPARGFATAAALISAPRQQPIVQQPLQQPPSGLADAEDADPGQAVAGGTSRQHAANSAAGAADNIARPAVLAAATGHRQADAAAAATASAAQRSPAHAGAACQLLQPAAPTGGVGGGGLFQTAKGAAIPFSEEHRRKGAALLAQLESTHHAAAQPQPEQPRTFRAPKLFQPPRLQPVPHVSAVLEPTVHLARGSSLTQLMLASAATSPAAGTGKCRWLWTLRRLWLARSRHCHQVGQASPTGRRHAAACSLRPAVQMRTSRQSCSSTRLVTCCTIRAGVTPCS